MLIEDVNTSLKRTVTYVLDDVIDEDDQDFSENVNLLRGTEISNNAMKATMVHRSTALPDIETESEENAESLRFGLGNNDRNDGERRSSHASSETGQSKSISWYVKYKKSRALASQNSVRGAETDSELDQRMAFSRGDHYLMSRKGDDLEDSDRITTPANLDVWAPHNKNSPSKNHIEGRHSLSPMIHSGRESHRVKGLDSFAHN